MASAKLTKTIIDATDPPATGRLVLWDKTVPGLSLRITTNGARSWSYVYRSGTKLRRLTLGRYGGPAGINPDEARRLAQEAAQAVRGGRDPAGERRARRGGTRSNSPATATVSSVVEDFLRRQVEPNCRPSTAAEYKRALRVDVLPFLGHRPIRDVSRRDLREICEAKVASGAPISANRMHAILGALWKWAAIDDEGLRNPLAGVPKPSREISRDRWLNSAELALLLRALPALGHPWAALFEILLLTGQRRGEVAGMRWTDVNLDRAEWTIAAESAKNGLRHVVPLTAPAIAVLERVPRIKGCDFIFSSNGRTAPSGFSKAAASLQARMALENAGTPSPDWRLHDLRRSAATHMAELDVAPHIIEAVLNHRSGHRAGVAGIYNRAGYEAQKRDALQRWADFLAALRPAP